MNSVRRYAFLRYAISGVIVLLFSSVVDAADRSWNYHDRPYTFLFGNHIDTHQETILWKRDTWLYEKGELNGWLYVFEDGALDDGTPILKHCITQDDYDAGCVAGWRVQAKPCIEEVNGCRAMFLYHNVDHPIWLLNPIKATDTGGIRGSRQHIPQPGSFTHFHWLTEGIANYPSSLAEVEAVFGVDIAVPTECNVVEADYLTTGTICPGYFLQLIALRPFGYREWAFRHGGEDLVLKLGVDDKTHSNLLTTYENIEIPENIPSPSDGGGGN